MQAIAVVNGQCPAVAACQLRDDAPSWLVFLVPGKVVFPALAQVSARAWQRERSSSVCKLLGTDRWAEVPRGNPNQPKPASVERSVGRPSLTMTSNFARRALSLATPARCKRGNACVPYLRQRKRFPFVREMRGARTPS